MLIPPQLRLDRRQPQIGDFGNNQTENQNDSNPGAQGGLNDTTITVVASVIAAIVFIAMAYFTLRTLRRLNCRPKFIPGKYLKERWRRWNVGVSYGQVPDGASLHQNDGLENGPSTTVGQQVNQTNSIRRDTSIRSIITLPAYSYTPKPTEQVIAREGERGGMDMVVEFPETAEEEETRREDLMESLYQVRVQRRQEIAEREARRQERREARERGDFNRLEQLREESRARARSRSSGNGSNINVSAATILAEAQSRGRDRRISSVSYADVGYVRHDGSRVRASSRDSDSRPLLTNGSSMSVDGPDRSSGSGFISVHSRGDSYSSTVSLATRNSDQDSLTPVPSNAASTPSIAPSTSGHEEGDVSAQIIPPPDYEQLDWGDAPPYEAPSPEVGEQPPRVRELTPLPTIRIDIASPIDHSPTTPTNTQSQELPEPQMGGTSTSNYNASTTS